MSDDKGIKLRKLTIQNFKAIDHLEIEFPAPRMKNDPDVFVLGSKNGVGKTSVLEAIVVALYSYGGPKNKNEMNFEQYLTTKTEGLVRSGRDHAELRCNLFRDGMQDFFYDSTIESNYNQSAWFVDLPLRNTVRDAYQAAVDCLYGNYLNPFMYWPFMYLHSYRRVQSGKFSMSRTAPSRSSLKGDSDNGDIITPSLLKQTIVQALMAEAGLFEMDSDVAGEEALAKLNQLLERYADGRIGKMRTGPDNTIELRIDPIAGGPSYPFDGLSSGQKEIISTLFLIWYHTRKQPAIVLIDEPELHLNAEWQVDLVRTIHEIAPWNQYIMATHSEAIFSSVDEDHRGLITASAQAGVS